MDIKITQNQFDNKKFIGINSAFKDLDVDKDGSITEKDVEATSNATIKNDLQKIFAQINQDSDEDIDVDFDDGELDNLKDLATSAAGLKASAAQTAARAEKTGAAAEATGAGKVIGGVNIEGYVDVDISKLDGKTEAELQELINKVENNIKLLNDKINEIRKQNEALQKDIDALKKDNAGFDADIKKLQDANKEQQDKITNLDSQINAAKTEKAQKEAIVKQEEEKLEGITREFMRVRKQLDEANARIIQQQNLEEREYEEEIERTTERAIADYNPKLHGDNFEVYFLTRLSSAGYVMFSKLPSLNAAAAEIGDTAKIYLDNLQLQAKAVYDARANVKSIDDTIAKLEGEKKPCQDIINDNNDKIKEYEDKKKDKQSIIDSKQATIDANNKTIGDLQKEITANQTKKTTLEAKIKETKYNAKDILSQISAAEKQLAKANNVDLTKCFIAAGADNKLHIYLNNGTSLARQYGKSGTYRGTDIVPMGSGYVNGLKEDACAGSGKRPIYRLSEVNADMTDGIMETTYGKYSTSSPLSFDVNGDGVQTSENMISYDIDGDGSLDDINDSADWVLAFDKDGNGIAGENGSELFGDNTDLDGDGVKDGYANGFEALKALAQKEGLVGEGDNVLDENDLNVLSEKYGLTMTKGYGGEAKSLSELGITQINLAETNDTKLSENFDGRNNNLMTQEGATFTVNGETREYADIWHGKMEFESSNDEAVVNAENAPADGVLSINQEETADVAPANAQEAKDDKKDEAEAKEKDDKKQGFGKLTTNKEGANLVQDKNGIVVLKGQVDFEGMRERGKFNPYARVAGKEKLDKYKKELEAEEQAKQDAIDAEKAEEAKKQEQKELEEKEMQKKLEEKKKLEQKEQKK